MFAPFLLDLLDGMPEEETWQPPRVLSESPPGLTTSEDDLPVTVVTAAMDEIGVITPAPELVVQVTAATRSDEVAYLGVEDEGTLVSRAEPELVVPMPTTSDDVLAFAALDDESNLTSPPAPWVLIQAATISHDEVAFVAFAALDEASTSTLVPLWATPLALIYTDDELAQQPPPPPRPRHQQVSGAAGGTSSGYWTPDDWCDPEDPNYCEPEPELEEDPDEEPAPAPLEALGEDFGDAVVDLFSGGAAFAMTRALSGKAKEKFGKHGAAVTSVAAFALSVEAAKKKKKGKAALVIGSGIATLKELFDLYGPKDPTPITVDELQQMVRDKKLTIRVKTREATHPKHGRVLVIRYVIVSGEESWYTDQVRKFKPDGTIDLGGTLLKRLRRRRTK